MITIMTIVEGHGEVQAFPIILRRIKDWLTPDLHVDILPPIRVSRDRFLNREPEFRRTIALAAGKSGNSGAMLILLDADDDCPALLGRQILERASQEASHKKISVVLANREYEAWLIAAAESITGQRGFSIRSGDNMIDPESVRDAKSMDKVAHGE